jgi:predicted dienelactone hydrolase
MCHDIDQDEQMTHLLRRGLTVLATLFLAFQAHAAEVGLMQIEVAGDARSAPIAVALFYPTSAAPQPISMGPFTLDVAVRGEPAAEVKALILLSHGTGGSELGHSTLAEALARNGYLVAALRHPGDNWQDRSLLQKSPERFFEERPRQASRVIDAILADPRWQDRIVADARGPRVGALGHSAGGYTVLALAGGEPDLARIGQHCRAEAAADPIFCGMGRSRAASSPPPAVASPLRDPRVRAVVAMAPVGVPLTAESLAAIQPLTMIYEAELDRFLVPRFHAEWVASNLPAAHLHRVPNAWHFAFMDPPSMPIPTEDGDVAANPPGFDREAFLKRLGTEITAFFDDAFR